MMNDAATIPTARPDYRLVIASIAGLWLCYFALATLRGWIVGFELDWPMMSRRVLVTLASMAVTAMLWPLLRLLDRQSLAVRAACVMIAALPASLLLAQLNQWIFADIEGSAVKQLGENQGISIRRDDAGNVLVDIPTPEPTATSKGAPASDRADQTSVILIDAKTDGDNKWRQLTDLATGRYFLLLAWAAIYLALANARQARLAERREGEYRRAAKAAELRSLRYQINPHFLFNTLNSLSALVMGGQAARAERMIQTLSDFYRHSLSEDPTADHSLAEEIELQKLYLDIEAVRFPDRLRTRFEIPAELASAQVPGMILQPLIENSVKYAVAASRTPVTIAIAARERGGVLELEVRDDGPGAAKADGMGIGLSNVRDRLGARFGDAASLASGPVEHGYRTVLTMPMGTRHG